MTIQKKRLAGLGAVMAVAATAAGFSLPAASAAKSDGLAKGHYTLTVYADQNWVQPAEKQLAAKFKQQTGITVQYNIVPDSTYQTLLTTKLNSGQAPGDIFMIQPPGGTGSGLETTFQVQKHAVDLSKQPWVNKEFKITRSFSTYKGKLYGQTIWDTISGSWVIVYDKTDFAKAGITSLPTTFAAFLADCAALKAKGINPIYEPISDGWHQVLWFNENLTKAEASDPSLVANLNDNKATFAGTPAVVTALTQVNELYHDGYFGPTALTDTFANSAAAIASEKYAMSIQNLSFPASVVTYDPSYPISNLGFMPVPILDNQYINQNPGGPTKLVYKQGKHVAGALEYLNFLAQPSSLDYLIAHEPTLVTLPWTGVKSKWDATQLAFTKAYKPSPVPVAQAAVNYDNPQWGNIGTDMVAMFTGQETPTQVAQNIDMRRTQEAQAAHDKYWP